MEHTLPAFVIEVEKVRRNLELLRAVQRESGVKVLFALKGFALPALMPLIRAHVSGVAASSLHEAVFAHTYFRQRVHYYAPAVRPEDVPALREIVGTWVFNSFSEYERYVSQLSEDIQVGLRVNPHFGSSSAVIYNPGRPGSRLGIEPRAAGHSLPPRVRGLHVHTLCEAGPEALEKLLEAMERHFGGWLRQVRWLNLGGGHLLTAEFYDVGRFIEAIRRFWERFPNLETIYIEPSAAVVWEAGYLASRVLDIHSSGERTWLMLDVSFTAHMPDTLEMPYKPRLWEALPEVDLRYPTYWLGGATCLAGDEMGPYSFPRPVEVGQILHFHDMAHYTFVKTTFFNGVGHPALVLREGSGYVVVKRYGYEDYKGRLGG
jgi:carboxynorspermidine decarboxylase